MLFLVFVPPNRQQVPTDRRGRVALALTRQLPSLLMPTVVYCPPNYFDLRNQKNPYKSRKAAVSRAKTRSQGEYLCGVFQRSRYDVGLVRSGDAVRIYGHAANQIFIRQENRYGNSGEKHDDSSAHS